MRHSLVILVTVSALLSGCDLPHITAGATGDVLARAQPSLQQEADWQLAHDAIPGALKTIEGFWIVAPDKQKLTNLLTEGYCQYGTGFVDDDWEIAVFAKDQAMIEHHNARATHIFSRCMNFALKTLGNRWQKEIFADTDTAAKLIQDTQANQRNEMMWVGLALGSIINHNLSRIEMIAYLSTVKHILERVLEIDAKHPPSNKVYAALPHIALGMVHSAVSPQMGGKPDLATSHFLMALKLTDNKMLLARALYGYRVGKQMNDQKLFHDQLKQVLETPPSVWPEQRLANEVAHRRARRYLSHEKEIF